MEEFNTHEVSKYLTEEELDRLFKLQTVFESSGWPLIKEWAEAQVTVATLEGASADSWDKNRVAFGRRLAWEDVLHMEDRYINEFQAVADSRMEEQLESEEGFE